MREAAGGVTPGYSLVRNYPVVYYTMPNFEDYGLHMGGARPDIVSYDFPLPDDLDQRQVLQLVRCDDRRAARHRDRRGIDTKANVREVA